MCAACVLLEIRKLFLDSKCFSLLIKIDLWLHDEIAYHFYSFFEWQMSKGCWKFCLLAFSCMRSMRIARNKRENMRWSDICNIRHVIDVVISRHFKSRWDSDPNDFISNEKNTKKYSFIPWIWDNLFSSISCQIFFISPSFFHHIQPAKICDCRLVIFCITVFYSLVCFDHIFFSFFTQKWRK